MRTPSIPARSIHPSMVPDKPETWARWAASVPAGFQFLGQGSEKHHPRSKLNCQFKVLSAFLQSSISTRQLGPLLIQLPPSLEFDHSG